MDELFHNIFDIISPSILGEWTKLICCFFYGDGKSEINYFIQKNGKYVDAFSLNEASDLLPQLLELKKQSDNIRKKDNWALMTLVIQSDGTFNVDYKYDSYLNTDFFDDWKKEFLL